VGALCARAAVRGAFLNVRINAAGMEDKAFVDDLLARGRKMEEQAAQREGEILAVVQARM
jgi:glutamate formiminotransferase/formiminotetrahydrofolate cyclodeaminase